MSRENLYNELQKRILILDGAMGSLIQQCRLEEKDFRGQRFIQHTPDLNGNNDLLSLTRPDIIRKIHRDYLAAGAEILETNTFNANRISQADYHLEELVPEMNVASARIAREVTDEYNLDHPTQTKVVAGSMGPTNKTASMSPHVNDPGFRAITFDDLVIAYSEQARGLIEGGVDILLVETVFDTLNAKAALFAIEEVFREKKTRIPIMVSGTITDASGRTLAGQTVEAFLNSVSWADLLSVGVKCALGARAMKPYVEELSRKAPFFVSAHPNAGLPNQFGGYDDTPQDMANQLKEFLEAGPVNIIGARCGTTPAPIRAL